MRILWIKSPYIVKNGKKILHFGKYFDIYLKIQAAGVIMFIEPYEIKENTMKKFTAGIIACVCAAACFAGCSGKNKSSAVDSSALIGAWRLIGGEDEAERGYIFGEDGKVSLYTDVSDSMHFEGGEFVFGEERIQREMIEYDGDKMTIDRMNRPLLVLDRIGAADMESFDGEYVVEDCVIQKSLLQGMAADPSSPPIICFSIKDSSAIVMAVNVMDYKYSGGDIEFSNYNGGASAVADISGTARLSGDELVIESDNGKESRLKRQNA